MTNKGDGSSHLLRVNVKNNGGGGGQGGGGGARAGRQVRFCKESQPGIAANACVRGCHTGRTQTLCGVPDLLWSVGLSGRSHWVFSR